MRQIQLVLLILLLDVSPTFASPVQDAYRAIPHRQTTYSAGESLLSAAEAKSLQTLFSYVDKAIVLRVSLMQLGHAGVADRDKKIHGLLDELEKLVMSLSRENLAEKLTPIRLEIIQAIREQKQYLKISLAARQPGQSPAGTLAGSELVQKSHQRLVNSYNKLMQLYPQETPHNKQAFYDHLCALDFI